jgi:hypothetical protein
MTEQERITQVYRELYNCLGNCTDPQTKTEVQEDLAYLQKYVNNPSESFLRGLLRRLQEHQPA